MLLNAIWRVRQDFSKSMIHFRQIGKKSGTHYRTYGVYTGIQGGVGK